MECLQKRSLQHFDNPPRMEEIFWSYKSQKLEESCRLLWIERLQKRKLKGCGHVLNNIGDCSQKQRL